MKTIKLNKQDIEDLNLLLDWICYLEGTSINPLTKKDEKQNQRVERISNKLRGEN